MKKAGVTKSKSFTSIQISDWLKPYYGQEIVHFNPTYIPINLCVDVDNKYLKLIKYTDKNIGNLMSHWQRKAN